MHICAWAQYGPLTQLAEFPAHNRAVPGSIPGGATIKEVTMTRSRYIKLRMAAGLTRNEAAAEARAICSVGLPYSSAGRLHAALLNVSGAFRTLGSTCLVFSRAIDQFTHAGVV